LPLSHAATHSLVALTCDEFGLGTYKTGASECLESARLLAGMRGLRQTYSNALGGAVDVSGVASVDAGDHGGLRRVGGGGAGAGRGGAGAGGLGAGQDGEGAGEEDGGEAHLGRLY